jgi:hypothetical protein
MNAAGGCPCVRKLRRDHSGPLYSKAEFDEPVEDDIADRPAHLFGQDDRGLPSAGRVPEARKFYPRRGRRDVQRANPMNFEQHTAMSISTAARAKSLPARNGSPRER